MLSRIIVIYFISFVHCSVSLFAGDLCQLENGHVGMCKDIHSCDSAKNDLVTMKKPPKLCGFTLNMPIICCPEQNNTYSTEKPTFTTEKPILLIEKPTFSAEKPENEFHVIDQDHGKVSLENCKKYADLVLVNISSPTLLPDVDYEIEDTCAIKKENYNESSIMAREFPHLASVGYDMASDKAWKCSAALISQQHVITAATCSNLPQLGLAKYVRVGSTSVRENFYHEKPLQYSNIKEFIKHPNFDQSTLVNNLAIIKLETPVKFTSIVRPVCLGVNKSSQRDVINVGWGTFNGNGYLNNEPLKNLLRITDPKTCSNLKNSQMCVKQVPGESLWQNCLVDQGSPLQEYHDKHYCAYNIIGVLSEWKDCHKGKPGVYTNISMYIPWIEKIVWG